MMSNQVWYCKCHYTSTWSTTQCGWRSSWHHLWQRYLHNTKKKSLAYIHSSPFATFGSTNVLAGSRISFLELESLPAVWRKPPGSTWACLATWASKWQSCPPSGSPHSWSSCHLWQSSWSWHSAWARSWRLSPCPSPVCWWQSSCASRSPHFVTWPAFANFRNLEPGERETIPLRLSLSHFNFHLVSTGFFFRYKSASAQHGFCVRRRKRIR